MAEHSASLTIKQSLEHVVVMDFDGHIARGYYEDAFTSVIDGFGWIGGDHSDTYAAIVCGFSSKMLGQTVTVTTDSFTSQFYQSGTHTIVLASGDGYDLTGVRAGSMYCLDYWNVRYPHSNPFNQGEGVLKVSRDGHQYALKIKVTGSKNYSNCGN